MLGASVMDDQEERIVKFYSYYRSSTAYRLRIALNLKQLTPEETVFVNLKRGEQHGDEYKIINPAASVPTLELESGETLVQSMALLEWLEEEYPTPALLPEDIILRSKVRAFANVVATEMHPLNNLRVLKYIVEEFGADDEQKLKWIHHWMHKGFEILESMIKDRTDDFCYGSEPSFADICLVPQIYNALRFDVDMSRYTRLMQCYDFALNVPEFDMAQPENQPDCPL